MSAARAIRKTIYSQYVAQQIYKVAQSGGGVWSFADFADLIGIKPTHNLRKRLKQAENEGLLWISYGLAGERGTCYLYNIRTINELFHALD